MARAAGMKGLCDGGWRIGRSESSSLLTSAWGQLDDDIAIVNVDGKDEYFDPGERYCEFKTPGVGSTPGSSEGCGETDAGRSCGRSSAGELQDGRMCNGLRI